MRDAILAKHEAAPTEVRAFGFVFLLVGLVLVVSGAVWLGDQRAHREPRLPAWMRLVPWDQHPRTAIVLGCLIMTIGVGVFALGFVRTA